MNLNEALNNYVTKLIDESIALNKPFSQITKEDVIEYLNLGSRDGQYFFTEYSKGLNDIRTGSFVDYSKDQYEDLLNDGGIDDCVNFIRSLKFPLKIYRGLVLDNESNINSAADQLGEHWTVNPYLFFGIDTGLRCCNNEEDITHVIIGQINNQNDIDLGTTLSLYAENSAGEYGHNWDETEDEVYIPDTTKIKILGIMPFEQFESYLRHH